jgi:serine/threonine protein kinase
MLVDAVGHMHSLGIYHLDIKPRNILLNGSLQIKLGDFGFSSRNKNSTALLGTVGFAAPEIHSRSIYDCELVDVYACGVVLFASVFGKLPFESSNPKIIMQELFLYERDCFWLMFAEKPVSDELKSLLEWMLSQDCKNRPSIEQLKTHPWFLQDVLMMDEIISLLSPQTKLI